MRLSAVSEGCLLTNPELPGDVQLAAAWNMALDEVMLERAASHRQLCLRFYSWAGPTVSLGYFQSLADRKLHRTSYDCPLVRRSSGGGALVHGAAAYDLTYSVAVPTTSVRGAVVPLYDCFHESLVEVLKRLGFEARLCAVAREENPKPFLCFQRHTVGDVLIGHDKVCGSAQRRLGQAILQHGTLLLERIPEAPELPGLATLHPEHGWSSPPDLRDRWLQAVRNRWSIDWTPLSLDAKQLEQVARKVSEKFTSQRWTQRR